MAFVDQYALATDATFSQRVQVAMMTAAVQVSAEALGADETVYDKRQQLAVRVLQSGGASTLQWFIWAVITNAVVTDASTDSDLQFTVDSVWDAVAGVRAAD
jgi:hypothetical protein